MNKPVKRDYNTKVDDHFHKINKLIDGGKYTASMNKPLDAAHLAVAKEEMKKKK